MPLADCPKIIEYLPLPGYILQDGVFRAVNREMARLTGYPEDELAGMHIAGLVHPEDLGRVMEGLCISIAGADAPVAMEWRALSRRGDVVHVRSHSSRADFSGRPAVLGLLVDITGQKRTAEELDMQRAYFKQLFENSPDGIVIIDGEDRFVDVNKGFEKIFQYTAEEVRGRRVNEAIVPEGLAEQAAGVTERAFRGGIVHLETVRRRKDGSLVDVSILAYPINSPFCIPDSAGTPHPEPGARNGKGGAGVHPVSSGGGGRAVIYVMYSDITGRRMAQKELQEFNERLEAANEELMAAEEELKQQLLELQKSEQALRESENKFRQLFHNANDGIVLVEILEGRGLGRFKEVNDVVSRRLGYTREEFLGLKAVDIVAPDHIGRIPEINSVFLSRGRITFETVCVSKGGHNIPFEISGHIFTLNGEKVGLLVARDVTDRALAREKLSSAHQQLMDIIEFLPDPTFVVDKDRKIIAWNRAMEEMTGVGKERMVGMGDYAYAVPFYGEPRPALIDVFFPGGGEVERLYDNIDRRGDTLFAEIFVPSLYEGRGAHIWTKASPLYDSQGNIVGAIESIRDITERKQAERQLKYLSMHDSLTGLYNRAYFDEEMRRLEAGRNRPFGIIVCDIDGLKLVNDTLGHQSGDHLLVAASNVIRESFRGGDVIARIGGDEFSILLPNSDRTAVDCACSRLLAAVDRYNEENPGLPLSISIGCVSSGDGTASVAELFKEADDNMYREKLHRSQSARSAIVQALMRALEARDFIAGGHVERLQHLVTVLGGRLGLPEQAVAELRLLARFHDIGKVGVSDRILLKPGRLTPGEAAEMRRHCEIGHRIAREIPGMAHIADWILKHHEWWNGGGYPAGIKGEDIPLECRILAIADAYDAMTTDRPYRKAMSHEKAVAEIIRCAGTQFDPGLAPVFVEAMEKEMF